MSSGTFISTDGQQLVLYRQVASVMKIILEGQRPASRVSLALQAAICDDDIVVVPKVTMTSTGKAYHVTGNARSAKEAINALDCPVKWGLAETPEKIPLIIQPVDCRARLIPLGRVRTTEEIYNFPKILTPAEFFALGAKFPKEQCDAPILDVWLDASGQFWYAFLYVRGDKRGVHVSQGHPGVKWDEDDRVPVRE